MSLGWGVIGTGNHVMRRMGPALMQAAQTKRVAVCSRDIDRAKKTTDRFGFARAYDVYDKFLSDPELNVVYVCTPNALHAEHAIRAARAGKHVLVEKPMALSQKDAHAMINACKDSGVRLGVGFHLRHHPAQRQACEAIAAGRMGALSLVETRWIVESPPLTGWWENPELSGAYILMARGVHLMDLICYLTGREPNLVSMLSNGQQANRPLEDLAVAVFKFGTDMFATLAMSRRAAGAQNGYSVYGSTACLHCHGTVGPDPTGTLRIATKETSSETSFNGKNPFQEEIEKFNEAVLEGRDPSASGTDGLQVVRMTEAALESAHSGRAVTIK